MGSLWGDDWAHKGFRGGVYWGDVDGFYLLGEYFYKIFSLRELGNDEAAGTGAALAGGDVGGLDDDMGGGLDIFYIVDDDGVIAAEF